MRVAEALKRPVAPVRASMPGSFLGSYPAWGVCGQNLVNHRLWAQMWPLRGFDARWECFLHVWWSWEICGVQGPVRQRSWRASLCLKKRGTRGVSESGGPIAVHQREVWLLKFGEAPNSWCGGSSPTASARLHTLHSACLSLQSGGSACE